MDSQARHVELGDDRAVLIATPDRQHFEQRLPGQDHAGRVYADLTLEPFEPPSGVDDLRDVGLGFVERPQLGGLGVAAVLRIEDGGQRHVAAQDRVAAAPS